MNGMTTFYNQCPTPQMFNYPLLTSPLIPVTYTTPILPVPVIISPQIIPPICPYTGVITQPIAPIVPSLTVDPTNIFNNLYLNNACSHVYETEFSTESASTEALSDEIDFKNDNLQEEINKTDDEKLLNPIEQYLNLPKDMFPTAKMLSLDPNMVIDEFCKLGNINENVSWILDVEFGIPRVPTTRTIAVYDVKFNSINCKNTPGAIHPGFEKCNSDFKRALLFYYDCVASNWYNGYISLNCDKSVENFQSWLQTPMQIFGMCWP